MYFQEGPYSKLKEELFYDAVETALDEEDASEQTEDMGNLNKENISAPKPTAEIMSMPKHRYSKEVCRLILLENIMIMHYRS